jgi:signal transduction histidine kinase
VDSRRSLTIRLIAGLAVTLTAVAVFSGYSILQLRTLRELQARTIDRNRVDSLLLLRAQNSLNSLAIAVRDMLDSGEPYPLTAFAPQFARIRTDLEDALAREEKYAPMDRTAGQRRYLAGSITQFWDSLDRIFAMARAGQEAEARTQIQLSLQSRQAALSAAVARLLVQNNESEEQTAARTHAIYAGVERNVYVFTAAMLILISMTGIYVVQYNRRMFQQVAELSQRRSELAQQLISMQENTFRSISRELHDDFGQILTAIGAMLQRADRRVAGDLREVREIVQVTLEKIRTLSHALHPVVLDEAGLESALDVYLSGYRRQTGIAVDYEKSGESRPLDRNISIHLYRVAQEALNNVARHAGTKRAWVRLRFLPVCVVLEVEDGGVGFRGRKKQGMGLVSMRERAELMKGGIEFVNGQAGGALVRVTVPVAPREADVAHA